MIVDIMNANLEENIGINRDHQESKNDTNPGSDNSLNKNVKKYREETNAEIVIEFLYNHFSKGIKYIGPLFAFALVTFVFVVTHSFVNIILPYWEKKYGIVFSVFISLLCIFILFNILFNYFLALLVKPGSTKDIKNSKYYSEINPYFFSEGFKKDVNIDLFLESSLEVENPNRSQSLLKLCKYCNEVKPLRSHHCQICGVCVFKMDHHCPWIDNCVGQNNHRYFILFLTHTLIGCIFINVLSFPIFFFNNVKDMPLQFNFVCILCLTGMVLLLFFNSWNWFLVFNGNTTIEFWSYKAGISSNGINNFSMNEIKENIFMVFGTKSLIKAILIPSIKMLPYSGLEWSRLVDINYKLETDCINSESNNLIKDNEILNEI